jgi:RNase P subunit RPR2
MSAAWCPRCQRHVRGRTHEVRDKEKRERRTETLCAECGILLMAKTQAAPA